MRHKEWADGVVESLGKVGEAVRGVAGALGGIKSSHAPVQAQTGLDGAAIASLLAEYFRNNNATTQALAIRIVDLASRYPQRAA